MDEHNSLFARTDVEPMKNLEEIVRKLKPTALIGVFSSLMSHFSLSFASPGVT